MPESCFFVFEAAYTAQGTPRKATVLGLLQTWDQFHRVKMFNLYQNMNRRDEAETRREPDMTGHDRFCQVHPKTRRKRRAVTRRAQSAIELDTEAMISARGDLRRGRSASIEEDESEEEKGYQLTNKIDSLAKILFNRVTAARNREQTDMSRPELWHNNNDNDGTIFDLPTKRPRNPCLYCLIRCWHRTPKSNDQQLVKLPSCGLHMRINYMEQMRAGRHQYTALDCYGPSACEDIGECMEMEKRSRDQALIICESYLEGSARYSLTKQLNNVGSRVDKHWFAVKDTTLKAERLLTLAPLSRNCPIAACPSMKETLNHLFLALQHPYISPVLDLDFKEFEGQNYVVLVQPINQGSLKDLIYGIERNSWNEEWSQKYVTRGKGLPLPQVQRLGRQILEALVFLKERGFPTVTHLHSGNVILQNGVARLAGLENTLLGFTSRIYPVVTSRSSHLNFIDTICFGHVLFEMCAGYELCSFKPTETHLSDLTKYPQIIQILEMIFEQQDGHYPSVEELLLHDLFRNIDLREMRSAPVTLFRPTLTPPVVNLLDGIKRKNGGKRLDSIDTDDMISLDSPVAAEYREDIEEHSLLAEIYNELSTTSI